MIVGSIAADLKAQKRALPGFMLNEARHAGATITAEITDRTPIGRRVDPATGFDLGPSGDLAAANTAKRPQIIPGGYRTGTDNALRYAADVEHGTRPHIIRGNSHLRFWSAGALRYARLVNHPGAPGHHMFALGLAAGDREHQVLASARLQMFIA